jgi:hypothetical protein
MSEPRVVLDAYAVGHEAGAIGCRGFNRRDHAPAAFAALRAVLDLHVIGNPGVAAVAWCGGCGDIETAPDWPCPTVRAITTALEAR